MIIDSNNGDNIEDRDLLSKLERGTSLAQAMISTNGLKAVGFLKLML